MITLFVAEYLQVQIPPPVLNAMGMSLILQSAFLLLILLSGAIKISHRMENGGAAIIWSIWKDRSNHVFLKQVGTSSMCQMQSNCMGYHPERVSRSLQIGH